MVELTLHIIPRKYKVKVLDRKDQNYDPIPVDTATIEFVKDNKA